MSFRVKVIRAALIAFALTLLLWPFALGCGHIPPPPPPPEGETCESACDRAAQLGCKWAKPTPHGRSCVEVCEGTIDVFRYDLACMTKAASCDAADACNQ